MQVVSENNTAASENILGVKWLYLYTINNVPIHFQVGLFVDVWRQGFVSNTRRTTTNAHENNELISVRNNQIWNTKKLFTCFGEIAFPNRKIIIYWKGRCMMYIRGKVFLLYVPCGHHHDSNQYVRRRYASGNRYPGSLKEILGLNSVNGGSRVLRIRMYRLLL